MLYVIKNLEELKKLNELVSLENQIKVVRLHDKLGKTEQTWKKYSNPSLNLLKMSLKK